jgi:hypothetical protein
MLHSRNLIRLAVVALAAAGCMRATVFFTPNSWEMEVYGTSTGLDQDGFSSFVTLSDSTNSFLNPRTSLGVSTECGAQACGATGQSVMGTFLATANLSTLSVGVAINGTGQPPQDVHESATALLQLNIPLIGSIAPGNQEQGSVTMSVHGSGVGDGAFESQPHASPSLTIGASLTTCTYDLAVHDVLGDDCFAPSASATWTSEPQTCVADGEVQPGCFGLGALPGVLSSDFLVYSDLTILHLEIEIGAQGDDSASADLSHTASFVITPPPGFTVDYSAFQPATTAAPEPRTYGFLLAGAAAILFAARRTKATS